MCVFGWSFPPACSELNQPLLFKAQTKDVDSSSPRELSFKQTNIISLFFFYWKWNLFQKNTALNCFLFNIKFSFLMFVTKKLLNQPKTEAARTLRWKVNRGKHKGFGHLAVFCFFFLCRFLILLLNFLW